MLIKDPEKTFFTADNHFGHRNIIDLANRPFIDDESMDKTMIKRWNEAVGPTDIVFHLGDFTLGYTGRATQILRQLNGQIFILWTSFHHDRRWLTGDALNYVIRLNPLVALECPEYGDDKYPLPIILCHYPLAQWDRQHYGAWHLHGHTHGSFHAQGKIYDVGVDNNGFRPISLQEIKTIMDSKEQYP